MRPAPMIPTVLFCGWEGKRVGGVERERGGEENGGGNCSGLCPDDTDSLVLQPVKGEGREVARGEAKVRYQQVTDGPPCSSQPKQVWA